MVKLVENFPLLKASERLYGIENPLIGLTGGIGSGKTTVGKLLMGKGLNLINADQLIHDIYKKKETISFLKKLAPNTINNEEIDFSELRKIFFSNSMLKNALENFLYDQLPKAFLAKLPKKKTVPILYDVPLLFEKGLENRVDFSVVVSTTREIQIKRVIERDQSDRETVEKILSAQMKMDEKVGKANYNIENLGDLEALKIETSKFFDLYFLR